MAKKSGAANLAGLAALGALGYTLLKGKKDDAVSSTSSRGGPEESYMGISDMEDRALSEGLKAEGPETAAGSTKRDPQDMSGIDYSAGRKPAASRSVAAKPSAPASKEDPSYGGSGGSGGGRGPAAGEREAYEASKARAADLMAAYKPRYTPPGRAPKTTVGKVYEKAPLKAPDFEYGIPGFKPNVLEGMKKGGAVKVKKMASGGVTRSSASKRADGIAQKGKTRGTMVMCGGGYAKGKK